MAALFGLCVSVIVPVTWPCFGCICKLFKSSYSKVSKRVLIGIYLKCACIANNSDDLEIASCGPGLQSKNWNANGLTSALMSRSITTAHWQAWISHRCNQCRQPNALPQNGRAHGINESALKKQLNKLKEAGYIRRIGGTRGYWEVR